MELFTKFPTENREEMLVQVIVLVAVLAVLSSAAPQSGSAKEAVVSTEELGARLVKAYYRGRSFSARTKATHAKVVAASKNAEGGRKVSKDTLSNVVSDGYFVESSRANSDCSGVSNEFSARRLGQCFGNTQYFCAPNGDDITIVEKSFANQGCTGTHSEESFNVPRCGFDEDAYSNNEGFRKIRNRCVAAADMPAPAPGLKMAYYRDDACTQSLGYMHQPYNGCELVVDGNRFHYLRFTGVNADRKQTYDFFSDASCRRKESSYTESTALDLTACQGPDDDGLYMKNYVVTA